jgi:nucleoside-diphosphate-sugar epimerase
MRGNVCDSGIVSATVRDIDVIVHLAAMVGTPACKLEPGVALATNVEGTKQLLSARHPDQGFILASTGSVYGDVSSKKCDENSNCFPTTLYGKTKLTCENNVRDAENTLIYRFSTAFGVSNHMRTDLLINDLTHQAVCAGEFSVYQPSALRSFIHVRDISRSILFAVREWVRVRDRIFNVGDERLNHTKREIAHLICGETKAVWYVDPKGEDEDRRDYVMSFARIRREGFLAQTSLVSGISELAKWVHRVDCRSHRNVRPNPSSTVDR